MKRRKLDKPKEQKVAEDFFPVAPRDVKYSIEKGHKPLGEAGSIIKEEASTDLFSSQVRKKETRPKTSAGKTRVVSVAELKKQTTKKRISKKPKSSKSPKISTKNNTKEFIPKKINLKEGGYELIITEKPQAALKIASFLG